MWCPDLSETAGRPSSLTTTSRVNTRIFHCQYAARRSRARRAGDFCSEPRFALQPAFFRDRRCGGAHTQRPAQTAVGQACPTRHPHGHVAPPQKRPRRSTTKCRKEKSSRWRRKWQGTGLSGSGFAANARWRPAAGRRGTAGHTRCKQTRTAPGAAAPGRFHGQGTIAIPTPCSCRDGRTYLIGKRTRAQVTAMQSPIRRRRGPRRAAARHRRCAHLPRRRCRA